MSAITRSCVALLVLAVSTAGTLASAQTTPPSTAPSTAPAAKPKIISAKLEISPHALDMQALMKNEMGYIPAPLAFTDEKPAGITKEPTYAGTPKYGAFRMGNGPHAITYFSIDEPKGQPGKLYIDLNQNGDLTDDGPGNWQNAKDSDGVQSYNSTVALHASWGSAIKEDESGEYSVMMYKRHGDSRGGYVKVSARAGTVELGGKTYNILLSENTNDGIFTVPAKMELTRRPVELMIDIDGDGKFLGTKETIDGKVFRSAEKFSLTDPFKLGDQWWLARPTVSGSEIKFIPSADPGASVAQAQQPSEERQILKAGVTAPVFTALGMDGKPVKLSDFKGKVVILDFWATWCGPCKASMPGLEKIYAKVKDKGVVVLSVCVFDNKEPYDAFIEKYSGKDYSFTFMYDPAGRDSNKGIASSLFGVSAIPSMFIIDREGKISNVIVGSGNEANIAKALDGQGIKVAAE